MRFEIGIDPTFDRGGGEFSRVAVQLGELKLLAEGNIEASMFCSTYRFCFYAILFGALRVSPYSAESLRRVS